MDYDPNAAPLIREADPELERLLAEEDAIHAGLMIEPKQYDMLLDNGRYTIIERLPNGYYGVFHDFGANYSAAETCLKALRIASTLK